MLKKKLVPFLIVSMAFALTGLIAVQAFWIREAMLMKAEEFDRGVNEALQATNYALEAQEASLFFAQSLDRKNLARQIDSMSGPVLYELDTIELSATATVEPPKRRVRPVNEYKYINGEANYVFSEPMLSPAAVDCIFHLNQSAMLRYQRQFHPDQEALEEKKHQEIKTRKSSPGAVSGRNFPAHPPRPDIFSSSTFHSIELNLDSLMELLAKDSMRFMPSEHIFYFRQKEPEPARVMISVGEKEPVATMAISSKPKSVKATVVRPKNELRKQVVQKKLRIDSLLNKVAFDYISPKKPIEQRISEAAFDSILRANLRQHGIGAAFSFQIVREDGDSTRLIYGEAFPGTRYYEARLFPNDMFNLNERLLVYFPNPTNFLLGNLLGMLVVSLALVLILFVIFFITISVLLRQKKLSDIKSDFINNMTHEFKTPIATINLAADALANPKVQDNQGLITKYLGIIKTENRRMNTHVEQVLQTAQLDRQELKLNRQPLDLKHILEHAVDLMQMQFENREAVLSLQCSQEHCFVEGDEMHLVNVFTNLFDNALKYAGEHPQVKVEGIVQGQKAIVRVIDNGIGMSRETRQRIFEKFYRVPTGNVHNIKGFGLGLSYVKAIISAHGGNVQVDSEPGTGSTFTITLPILNTKV